MITPASRLYLVVLEGPPSRFRGGAPETMGVWTVADSPEGARARAWDKVYLGDRTGWKVTGASDRGTPRPADEVELIVDEPTPGIVMERLVAHPWPEYPGMLGVTATPTRGGGFKVSSPQGSELTADDARRLAVSLVAVADAAEARWGAS